MENDDSLTIINATNKASLPKVGRKLIKRKEKSAQNSWSKLVQNVAQSRHAGWREDKFPCWLVRHPLGFIPGMCGTCAASSD